MATKFSDGMWAGMIGYGDPSYLAAATAIEEGDSKIAVKVIMAIIQRLPEDRLIALARGLGLVGDDDAQPQ